MLARLKALMVDVSPDVHMDTVVLYCGILTLRTFITYMQQQDVTCEDMPTDRMEWIVKGANSARYMHEAGSWHSSTG